MSAEKREQVKKQNPVLYYGIIIVCAAIMFLFKYVPPFAPEITSAGMGVLGVFIGVVILWSTVGGSIWPSILGIVALGCCGYTSIMGAISSSLGAFMVFNMICVTAMTSALSASGADAKIARWLISRKAWEGKPYLFTFIFLFAFFLVSSVTFAFAMIFLCWTILRKMAEELGVSMRHPYFVAMTVYSVVATSLGEFVIPVKGWQYALCALFSANSGGEQVNLGLFIVTTFVIGVLIIIILVLLMKPLFKVDFSIIKNYKASEETKSNNRLTKNQIVIVVVLIVSMLLCILVNYVTGDSFIAKIFSTLGLPGLFGLACVVLCALKDKTGEPILNFSKVMTGMVWAPVLLVAAATALGSALVSADCGFMAFFSRTLTPIMSGQPVFVVYACIILATVILTNIGSNTGIGIMMVPIAVPLCAAAGCNMGVAAIVCIYSACFGFILPGAAAVSPLMYSNPDLKKPDIFKHTSLAVALYVVIGCIVFPLLDMIMG